MTGNYRLAVVRGLVLGAAAGGMLPHIAQAQSTSKSYDEQYAAYLAAARVKPTTNTFWMANLTNDIVARHQNDIVTIRVEEAVSASGAADMKVSKNSSASAAFPSPISTALGKFLPASTDTKAAGSGSTSRTTALTAMLTGRVTEVLPNGDLVIEGVREIDINNDRQIVVLTGVVRVVDIQPGNVAPSSRISQLQIRCLSQGLIRDSLSPGWLIRALNKIF